MKSLLLSVLLLFSFVGYADPLLVAPKLQPGDTVELISSGFRIDTFFLFEAAKHRLKKLGLKVVVGNAVTGHSGYFAGDDDARAADINAAFANPNIKAIFEIRGGWGSARLLDKINYAQIQQHPKIFVGFSDITTLLLAIHHKTGLVTFHGPMPGSFTWPSFTTDQLKAMLFDTKPVTLQNPAHYPIITITPGTATGTLLGGNLTILTTLLGTAYAPTDWKGKILFVEDTHVDAYEIDRALTQLERAGVLQQLSGIVVGTCVDCTRQIPGSPTIEQVYEQHLKPLHIPAWTGAMIGHQSMIWTVPEGVPVTINANKGTIQLLQAAVK